MNASRCTFLVLLAAHPICGQDTADPNISYARVVVPEIQPRCFASPRSPFYEDVLREGDVVQVGDAVGGYRQLLLPMGVTGYVHKRFTTEPVEGKVTTAATNVSFRYRPKSSEVPAMVLPKDTELAFLTEQDDWWKVRYEGAACYVAEADVQAFEQSNPTLEASYESLTELRSQQWRDAVEGRESARRAAEATARRDAALDGLVGRFEQIRAQPVASQDFAPLVAEVEKFAVEAEEGSPQAQRAAVLRKEIERQQLLARAFEVVEEPEVKDERAQNVVTPEPVDPLSRFDAVGWLRHQQSRRAPDYFTLEKGGKLMFVVTCSSGRYDLRMFDGVEVGVKGGKARPSPDTVRELDVLKLEVLQLGR